MIERRNRLHTIKPTSGRLALPANNGFYPIIFLGDVADEYGLVVCNPVSEFADFEHLIMRFMTQLLHRFTTISVRKNSSKMWIPEIIVMRSGQHGFPKYKFQLGNHFASRWLHSAYIKKFVCRVKMASRIGQSSDEAVGPRPIRAMHHLYGICDAVAHRHLTYLERDYKGRRKLKIPLIKCECVFRNIVFCLQIGCKSGRREYIG